MNEKTEKGKGKQLVCLFLCLSVDAIVSTRFFTHLCLCLCLIVHRIWGLNWI